MKNMKLNKTTPFIAGAEIMCGKFPLLAKEGSVIACAMEGVVSNQYPATSNQQPATC